MEMASVPTGQQKRSVILVCALRGLSTPTTTATERAIVLIRPPWIAVRINAMETHAACRATPARIVARGSTAWLVRAFERCGCACSLRSPHNPGFHARPSRSPHQEGVGEGLAASAQQTARQACGSRLTTLPQRPHAKRAGRASRRSHKRHGRASATPSPLLWQGRWKCKGGCSSSERRRSGSGASTTAPANPIRAIRKFLPLTLLPGHNDGRGGHQ